MAIDFPNPNITPTFTSGTKNWQWSGEQWVAKSYTEKAGSQNGILKSDGLGNFSTHSFNVNSITSSFSATKIGEITLDIYGNVASFGIQPVGTYEVRYISGHVRPYSNQQLTLNCRIYFTPNPNTIDTWEDAFGMSVGQHVRFYHMGGYRIAAQFIDNPYGDNSGSGITFGLYQINFE